MIQHHVWSYIIYMNLHHHMHDHMSNCILHNLNFCIIFIMQYIHYHIRPCLIIPHHYTWPYSSLQNEIASAYQHSTRIIAIITPLSSVSLPWSTCLAMSSKETAERHFKTFYQARRVVNPATFWWSLSCFGIQVCDLHVVSGFQMWPFKRFFWIWTCFSLHLSKKISCHKLYS